MVTAIWRRLAVANDSVHCSFLGAGTSTAHAEPAPSGGVLVKASWGSPCPGSVEEHWRLQSAQTLLCDTLLEVEGKEAVNTRAVYRRRR